MEQVSHSILLVSVAIITYNQENFIRQTLDNILSQKRSFDLEIVIGEDKGTDSTRKICEEYQAKHSDIIRLLPSDRNYGVMPNFVRALSSCKGKYVAICEGDDYWCDDQKLQKQVDILEKNDDCSICSHANYDLVRNEAIARENTPFRKEGKYKITEYIKSPFFHTSSILFRNMIDKNFFPEWYTDVFAGDHFLVLLLTEKKDIYYLHEYMSVYRINEGSITNKWKLIQVKNSYIKHVDLYNEKTQFRFDKEIRFSKKKWELMVGYLERSYFSGLGLLMSGFLTYTRYFGTRFSSRLLVKYLFPFMFKK